MSQLAWLEGRWEGVKGGLAMEEHWTSARGGALHARVEGPQDGKLAAEEWVWTRSR